jgi:hypothetical protein
MFFDGTSSLAVWSAAVKLWPKDEGEPAASGAEKCLQACGSQAVWSAATKK